MQHIYCISGLAADHRMFKNLSINGYELLPLPWVAFDKADNMASYAVKMVAGINDEHAIIIGLSFGGMLAVEIAKAHPSWKIFIVSSAKTTAELGYDSDFLRWLSGKDIVPTSLLNKPFVTGLYLLGARTDEEKKLMSQIIKDSDAALTKWSINTLLNWNNTTYTANVTHIHGTDDKVIRSANVKPDYWVAGGAHMMIYNRAAEVSKIISDCLAS